MNNEMCHIKKCVYQLKCTKCNEIYLGSTVRTLHIRVKEHLKDERSSVFEHSMKCKNDFEARAIAKARDNTSLRFKEALFIQQKKPSINAKRECDELLSLTFS